MKNFLMAIIVCSIIALLGCSGEQAHQELSAKPTITPLITSTQPQDEQLPTAYTTPAIFKTKQEIIEWMTYSAKPGLHAIPSDKKCWSKIGGIPDLPKGTAWPTWNGAPLSFLAQLDFVEMAAVKKLPGFPDNGRIYFFYDQEQSTSGFDPKDRGSWVVLYSSDSKAETSAVVFPEGVKQHGRFKEKLLTFLSINSMPEYVDRIKIEPKVLTEEDREELRALKSRCYGKYISHQVGGYPSAIYDKMELECQLVSNGINCGDPSGYKDPRVSELKEGANDWILLFQIESDDDAGMMWGDSGELYFWIKKQDLAKRDFSKVWMTMQSA